MAAGTALLPYSTSYYLLLFGVGMISAASGILIPALAYLVSLAAGVRQGAVLGAQTAAANLGQAAGSAAAGWLFGVFVGAPFWVTAGLLGFGALLAMRMPTSTRSWIG
jgi:MFS family permease